VGFNRLQQWLLRLGLVISAVLLVRFAIDFSKGMRWWLSTPFWALVAVTLGVGVWNILGDVGVTKRRAALDSKRGLFLALIPIGFLAASFDCTGLSLSGCSPVCTLIKLVWIPLIAVVCVVCIFTRNQVWLTAIVAMSFVPLAPHCVCYNVGNGWWIDRIGASPLCYGWGFVVSVLVVGALSEGAALWPSLLVCLAIIGGATGFFVSHHYFQFPW